MSTALDGVVKKKPGEESAEQHAVTRPPWTPSGRAPNRQDRAARGGRRHGPVARQ
jgi:hypothetical protein